MDSPLLIRFSDPMIPQTFEGRIDIFPQESFRSKWQNHNRELIIFPERGWKPGARYRLSLGGVRNIMLVRRDFYFDFRTADYPQVESFVPENGSRNVILDIEDPIVVRFKGPFDGFDIKVAVDPPADLENRIDPERDEMALIPRQELGRGKKYSFEVMAKGSYEGNDAYRKIFSSDFTTRSEAPQVWEKDFALRLEQAKLHTPAQIEEGKYIDINLKSQVLSIFEDGSVQDAYIISSGKRGMDTPQGTFRIANKFPRAWSKKYALFMPYWMAIVPSGDYGIHELPEWPGGYKEGANHLGTPVSHGCVRLGVGAAQRVYDWTEVGTPVVVHS